MFFLFPFGNRQMDGGGTENMSRVKILCAYSCDGFERCPVAYLSQQIERPLSIVRSIQRFNGRKFFLRMFFIDEFNILFLNMRAVHQHDTAEIGGCGSAKDRTLKPLFHQIRKVAGMIDVRMGKHDGIN